jgi:nitrite reductase (NADH) small subunit/3-phenylpropionate/trans-cinnamate dioxygenase ferredoxin subunit
VTVVAVVKVAAVGDVAPGTGTVVEVKGKTLALFNLNGTFYTLDNTCTHMGGPLGEGDVQGNIVTCPWHGSQFDITTGDVVGPPARRPVAAYRTRTENGAVMVELPDE